jgi:glycosyltransferase involved in cell wall biosynthesis
LWSRFLERRREGLHRATISVIIPAYNEENTIGTVISNTSQILDGLDVPYEIIVVNDGSTDKTGFVASNYKVTVLTNSVNRGKGYSLRRALKLAQGEIIVTLDSDGEHKPKEIPDLLEPLSKGVDVVAGSRFLGRQTDVTTKLNVFGNFFFNTAIMTLTGQRVTDSQTGFRAVKKDVLDKLNLTSDGYEIETEITVKSLCSGFVLKEMPISVERRKYSISKLKILSDGAKILKTIVKSSLQT